MKKIIAIVLILACVLAGMTACTKKCETCQYGEWETVVAATCSVLGEENRICSICGDEEKKDIETLPHTFEGWVTVIESTCTQKGEQKRICSVCGAEEKGELELAAHTYGEWVTKTDATCSAAGTKSRSCTICSNEESGTIDKKGHNVEESTGKCKSCGAQISSPKVTLTTSNIYDYLSFDVNSEGVVVTEEFGSLERGKGKVRVTASRLQNVSFNNVKLIINLETSSGGWGSMTGNIELVVPYDGNVNKVYNIASFIESYVSSSPNYRLKIKSVSGTVTAN